VSYEVIVERKAHKAITRSPSAVYSRVVQAIDDLADDPRPRHYRIVYDVDDERREVFVAEVWHRQRDYR
jgi:mRNA-degrading endonuclease RelE of RelBE toxin-antitoxin system